MRGIWLTFLPLLAARGKKPKGWRKSFLVEYWAENAMPWLVGMTYKCVRTDRYKFIRYKDLQGMDELYDLQNDPHELDNLLPNRVPTAVLRELTTRLNALTSGKQQ